MLGRLRNAGALTPDSWTIGRRSPREMDGWIGRQDVEVRSWQRPYGSLDANRPNPIGDDRLRFQVPLLPRCQVGEPHRDLICLVEQDFLCSSSRGARAAAASVVWLDSAHHSPVSSVLRWP